MSVIFLISKASLLWSASVVYDVVEWTVFQGLSQDLETGCLKLTVVKENSWQTTKYADYNNKHAFTY